MLHLFCTNLGYKKNKIQIPKSKFQISIFNMGDNGIWNLEFGIYLLFRYGILKFLMFTFTLPKTCTMSVAKKDYKRITTRSLIEMKANGEKISMLTAYDFTMAKIVDMAGVDVILVGDSASNVMAGHETTLPITLDQMIYHASSVVRAVTRALVVVDLPFGSYQSDPKEALRSAIRIMKESGGHAVKLEGGREIKDSIKKILNAGIPVMGHLGLTPQSIYKFGTYTVRAKEEAEAQKLIDDAQLLERLGCFAVVLEKIPAQLAQQVAKSITIPVIGIGAGGGVDGQVLVIHDMLGMNNEFSPRFLRRYLNLYESMTTAIGNYVADVKSADFPNAGEQY
jgi:3-methyl-2-oxobutanoate hydroxymethyltransferase